VIVRWRWLDISTHSNTGMVDVHVHLTWGSAFRLGMRVMQRVPIDQPTITFIRKSTYTLKFIIRPGGGNAMRIACDTCHADYPFNWQMTSVSPCANCAVPGQSGVRVNVGGWSWERVRSV